MSDPTTPDENGEDVFDRYARHTGLTGSIPPASPASSDDAEPSAEWSADGNRLVITEEFAARTQSFAYRPTRAALAARSWGAVKRITDPSERRRAMDRHFDQFPPAILSATGR